MSESPTARPRRQSWGKVFLTVYDELRHQPYADAAAHLYGLMKARYHPDQHPTPEDLMRETGWSRAKLKRALKPLEAIGRLGRDIIRQPGTGYVTGVTYHLIDPSDDDIAAEPPSLRLTSEPQAVLKDTQRLTSEPQDGGLRLTSEPQGGGLQLTSEPQGEPAAQNRPSLRLRSEPARSLQITEDQIRDLVVDHRGSKQQAATISTARQQQHGPPTNPPDERPPTPTPPEVLGLFYAGWEHLYDVGYDRCPKDADLIDTLFDKVRGDGRRALRAVELFLACSDPTIIGRDRSHPLGLLVHNVGRLLATQVLRGIRAGPSPVGDDFLNDPVRRANAERALEARRAVAQGH